MGTQFASAGPQPRKEPPCEPVMVAYHRRWDAGMLFLVEMAFCVGLTVFQRTLFTQDPAEGFFTKLGWGQVGADGQFVGWKDIGNLRRLADIMAGKGWEVTWC